MRVPLSLWPDKNTGYLIGLMLIVSLIPVEPCSAALHHSNRESARIIDSLSDLCNIFGSSKASDGLTGGNGRGSLEFSRIKEDTSRDREPFKEKLRARSNANIKAENQNIMENQDRNLYTDISYQKSDKLYQDKEESAVKSQALGLELSEDRYPGSIGGDSVSNFSSEYNFTKSQANGENFEDSDQHCRASDLKDAFSSIGFPSNLDENSLLSGTEAKLKRELSQNGFLFHSTLDQGTENNNFSKSSLLTSSKGNIVEDDKNFLFIENRPVANREHWRNLYLNGRHNFNSRNYLRLKNHDDDVHSVDSINNQYVLPEGQFKVHLSTILEKAKQGKEDEKVTGKVAAQRDKALHHDENYPKTTHSQHFFPNSAILKLNEHSKENNYFDNQLFLTPRVTFAYQQKIKANIEGKSRERKFESSRGKTNKADVYGTVKPDHSQRFLQKVAKDLHSISTQVYEDQRRKSENLFHQVRGSKNRHATNNDRFIENKSDALLKSSSKRAKGGYAATWVKPPHNYLNEMKKYSTPAIPQRAIKLENSKLEGAPTDSPRRIIKIYGSPVSYSTFQSFLNSTELSRFESRSIGQKKVRKQSMFHNLPKRQNFMFPRHGANIMQNGNCRHLLEVKEELLNVKSDVTSGLRNASDKGIDSIHSRNRNKKIQSRAVFNNFQNFTASRVTTLTINHESEKAQELRAKNSSSSTQSRFFINNDLKCQFLRGNLPPATLHDIEEQMKRENSYSYMNRVDIVKPKSKSIIYKIVLINNTNHENVNKKGKGRTVFNRLRGNQTQHFVQTLYHRLDSKSRGCTDGSGRNTNQLGTHGQTKLKEIPKYINLRKIRDRNYAIVLTQLQSEADKSLFRKSTEPPTVISLLGTSSSSQFNARNSYTFYPDPALVNDFVIQKLDTSASKTQRLLPNKRDQTILIQSYNQRNNVSDSNHNDDIVCSEMNVCQWLKTSKPLKEQIKESIKSIYPGKSKCVEVCDQSEITQTRIQEYEPQTSIYTSYSTPIRTFTPSACVSQQATLISCTTRLPTTGDRLQNSTPTTNSRPTTSRQPLKITSDINHLPQNEPFYIFNVSTTTSIYQTAQTTNFLKKPLENEVKQKSYRTTMLPNQTQIRKQNHFNTARKQPKTAVKSQLISKSVFVESSNLIQTGESNSRNQLDLGSNRQTFDASGAYALIQNTSQADKIKLKSSAIPDLERNTDAAKGERTLGITASIESKADKSFLQDDVSKKSGITESVQRDLEPLSVVESKTDQTVDISFSQIFPATENYNGVQGLSMQFMMNQTNYLQTSSMNETEICSATASFDSSDMIQTKQKTEARNITPATPLTAMLNVDAPVKLMGGCTSTDPTPPSTDHFCGVQTKTSKSNGGTKHFEIMTNIYDTLQSITEMRTQKTATVMEPEETTRTPCSLNKSSPTEETDPKTAPLRTEAVQNCNETIRTIDALGISNFAGISKHSSADDTATLQENLKNACTRVSKKVGTSSPPCLEQNDQGCVKPTDRVNESSIVKPQRPTDRGSKVNELIYDEGSKHRTLFNESFSQNTLRVDDGKEDKAIISMNKVAIENSEQNHSKLELSHLSTESTPTTPTSISGLDGEKSANPTMLVNYTTSSRNFTESAASPSTPNNFERQINDVMGVLDQLLGNLSAVNNHLLAYPAVTTALIPPSPVQSEESNELNSASQIIDTTRTMPWVSQANGIGQPFELRKNDVTNRADPSTIHGGLIWNVNNATFMINGGSSNDSQRFYSRAPHSFKKENDTNSRAIEYSHPTKGTILYEIATRVPSAYPSQNFQQETKLSESQGKNSMQFFNKATGRSITFTIGGYSINSRNDGKNERSYLSLDENSQYSGVPNARNSEPNFQVTTTNAENKRFPDRNPANTYKVNPNLQVFEIKGDTPSTNGFYHIMPGAIYATDLVKELGNEGSNHMKSNGPSINFGSEQSINAFNKPRDELFTKNRQFAFEISTLSMHPFAVQQNSILGAQTPETQIKIPKEDSVGEYLNYSWQISKNGTDAMMKNSIEMRKAGSAVPQVNIMERVPQIDRFNNVLKIQNYLPQNLSQTVYNYNNYDSTSSVAPRKITHLVNVGSDSFEGSNAMTTSPPNVLPYSILDVKKPDNGQVTLNPSDQTPSVQVSKTDKNRKATTLKTGYFQLKKRLNQASTEELKNKNKKIKADETLQKQFLLDVLKNSSSTLKEFQDKMQQLNDDVQRQRQLLLNLQSIQEKKYHRKFPLPSGDQLNKLLDSILKKSQTVSLDLSPNAINQNTHIGDLKNLKPSKTIRTTTRIDILQLQPLNVINEDPAKQKAYQTKYRVFPNEVRAFQVPMKAVFGPNLPKTDEDNFLNRVQAPTYTYTDDYVGQPVVLQSQNLGGQNLVEINTNAVSSKKIGQNNCFQLSSNVVCFTVPTPACRYVDRDSSALMKQESTPRRRKPKDSASISRAVNGKNKKKGTIQHIKNEIEMTRLRSVGMAENNQQYGDLTNLTGDERDNGLAQCYQGLVKNTLQIGKPNAKKLQHSDNKNGAAISNVARFHQRQRQKKIRTDANQLQLRSDKHSEGNEGSNQRNTYVLVERKAPFKSTVAEMKLDTSCINSSMPSKVATSAVFREEQAGKSVEHLEVAHEIVKTQFQNNEDDPHDLEVKKHSVMSNRNCINGQCSFQPQIEYSGPAALISTRNMSGQYVRNAESTNRTISPQNQLEHAMHPESNVGKMIPENLLLIQPTDHLDILSSIDPFIQERNVSKDSSSNDLCNNGSLFKQIETVSANSFLKRTTMGKLSAGHPAKAPHFIQSSKEVAQVSQSQNLANDIFLPITEPNWIQLQHSAQAKLQLNSIQGPSGRTENIAPIPTQHPKEVQNTWNTANIPTVLLAIRPYQFPLIHIRISTPSYENRSVDILSKQFAEKIENKDSSEVQYENYYNNAQQESDQMPPIMLMQSFSPPLPTTSEVIPQAVFSDMHLEKKYSRPKLLGASERDFFAASLSPLQSITRPDMQLLQSTHQSLSKFPSAIVQATAHELLIPAPQPQVQQIPQRVLSLMELQRPLQTQNSPDEIPVKTVQITEQPLPIMKQNPLMYGAVPERESQPQVGVIDTPNPQKVAPASIQPFQPVFAQNLRGGPLPNIEYKIDPQSSESIATTEPERDDGLLPSHQCNFQPQYPDAIQFLRPYPPVENQRSLGDNRNLPFMAKALEFKPDNSQHSEAVRLPIQYDQSQGNRLPEMQLEHLYPQPPQAEATKVVQPVPAPEGLETNRESLDQSYHLVPIQILYDKLPSQPISPQLLAGERKPGLTLLHPPMLVLPSVHLTPTSNPLKLITGDMFQVKGASESHHHFAKAQPVQILEFAAPSQKIKIIAPFIQSDETVSQQSPVDTPESAQMVHLQANNQYSSPGMDLTTLQSSGQLSQTFCSCTYWRGLEQSPAQPTNAPQTQPANVPQTQPANVPQTQPSNAPQTQPANNVPQTQPPNAPQTQPANVPQMQPSNAPQTQPANVPQTNKEPNNNNDASCINNIYINCCGKRQPVGNLPGQQFFRVKSVSKSAFENSGHIGNELQTGQGKVDPPLLENLHERNGTQIQNYTYQILGSIKEPQKSLRTETKHKNHTLWVTAETDRSDAQKKNEAELSRITCKIKSSQRVGSGSKLSFRTQKWPISATVRQQTTQFQTYISTNRTNGQQLRGKEKHSVRDDTPKKTFVANRTVRHPFYHNISFDLKAGLKDNTDHNDKPGYQEKFQVKGVKNHEILTSHNQDDSFMQQHYEGRDVISQRNSNFINADHTSRAGNGSLQDEPWLGKRLNRGFKNKDDTFKSYVDIKEGVANLKESEDFISLRTQGKAYVLESSPNTSMNDRFLEKYISIVTTKVVNPAIHQNYRLDDGKRQYKQLQFGNDNFQALSLPGTAAASLSLRVSPKADSPHSQSLSTPKMLIGTQSIQTDSHPVSIPTISHQQQIPSTDSSGSMENFPLPELSAFKLPPDFIRQLILNDKKLLEDYYSKGPSSPNSARSRIFYSTSGPSFSSKLKKNVGPMPQIQSLIIHPLGSKNRFMNEIKTSLSRAEVSEEENFNSTVKEKCMNFSQSTVTADQNLRENLQKEEADEKNSKKSSKEDILQHFFAKIKKIKENFLSCQKNTTTEIIETSRQKETQPSRPKMFSDLRNGGSKITTFKPKTKC